MLEAHGGAGCGAVNGRLYLFGGSAPAGPANTVTQIYNPGTEAWSFGAPSSIPRGVMASGVIGTKVYLAGGWVNSDANTSTNALEIYDAATNTWANGAAMPTVRGATGSGVIAGKLYVAGGQTSFGSEFSALEIYDPLTNTWAVGAPLPAPLSHPASAAIGGKLYLAGGFIYGSGGTYSRNLLQIYDVATASWTTGAPMPTPRYATSAGVIDGKLVVVGGLNEGGHLSIVEIYDPALNSWTTGASLPQTCYFPAVGAVGPHMFVAGGGSTTGASGNGALQVYSVVLTVPLVLKDEGAPTIDSAKFVSFGNPTMNAEEHMAFCATVTGIDSVATKALMGKTKGIWADDSAGVRQLIVRNGDSAPGTTGAVFSAFSDPVYNSNEDVAFIGTLKTGTGDAATSPTNTVKGCWIGLDASSSLQLVARAGSQAPGCSVGATFKAFTRLVLPDQGGLVLLGTLNENQTAGISSSNNLGIWAADTSGALRLILRKGDTHPSTGMVVKALSFLTSPSVVSGQTRSFSQSTGNLLYRATFADGSSGIFKVVLP